MAAKWKVAVAAGGIVVVGVVTVGLTHRATAPGSAPPTHQTTQPAQTHPPATHVSHLSTSAKPQPTSTAPPIPHHYPIPPSAAQVSGSGATATFTAATHAAPPVPLQVVALPWAPTTHWAVEPVGIHVGGNSNPTLWFGMQTTRGGPWTWIPSTLPGALNPSLPAPVGDALQLAWDLTQRDPGPTTAVGNITWDGITGEVGKPVGWTLVAVSKLDSPLAQPSMGLDVWQPSYRSGFSGLYGLQTVWDAHNAPTGTGGFLGFVAEPGPMRTIAASPPGPQ